MDAMWDSHNHFTITVAIFDIESVKRDTGPELATTDRSIGIIPNQSPNIDFYILHYPVDTKIYQDKVSYDSWLL